MEIPFTDAHTHHLPAKGNILSCTDLSRSSLSDFPADKIFPVSFGIHPAETETGKWESLCEKIRRYPDFAAVGECGMDRNIPIDMEKQKMLFLRQCSLAADLGKPVIIHCVKAWDILYGCAKRFPAKKRRWLIHSFRGDIALAKDLLRHNFTLSLAPQMILHAPGRAEKFQSCPFLLETDDSKENITILHQKMAAYCKMNVERLKEKTYHLFHEFFYIPEK
ncbi:MAG: TatD family hydrolase [Lentisphaeria bacterium]|nr:TatD family hydrolase [Lentisphaeria bacterium]